VAVDDVYTDVEFIPWRLLSEHDGYSISVPLVYNDTGLGVLNLFFGRHVQLNDERLRLLQTMAATGATAIANALLYEGKMRSQAQEANDQAYTEGLRLAS
jgi:GAF domain-containing protein